MSYLVGTRRNPIYSLNSYDIPKGKIQKGKQTRALAWERIEIHGKKHVAVVCVNASCRKINIIAQKEVRPDGFVDRGRGLYDISCIKCRCGTCYWPYLLDWKKKRAAKKR